MKKGTEREKFHNYYGFICHREPDKKFALKLQRKLERYRIPGKIRKENGIKTSHIRHIFVDNPDLYGAELKQNIIDSLNISDKLIVLCSRASASPVNGEKEWSSPQQIDWRQNPAETGWIGFEIRTFMDKNPEDKPYKNIIPVVIDGDPAVGDCFHYLLKEYIDRNEIRWYDFREWGKLQIPQNRQGKRDALTDLIIELLSLSDVEEFRRRDKTRRRLQTISAGVGAAVLGLCSVWGYDYWVPHEKIYQDYILVDEKPVGIHELSDNERKKVSDYYSITTRKSSRTIRLEHLNSCKTPVEEDAWNHPYGPMIAVYKCRDNGKLDVAEYLDRNGIVQMTYSYATDMAFVSFQENQYVSRQVYPISSINAYGIPNRMKIDRYAFNMDEEGKLFRRMYMSGVNYAINEEGIAGEEYIYDSQGRITSIYFLNRKEERTVNQNGVSGLKLTYGKNGAVSCAAYYGLEDELTYGPDAFAYMEMKEDGKERVTEYYGIDGNLVISEMGYAICRERYNDKMQVEYRAYYGTEQEPAFCEDKFHAVSFAYNEFGDPTVTEYFNGDGERILCKDGYAVLKLNYDPCGNVLQEDYYGSDNQPLVMDNQAFRIKRKFDDKGYLREEAYYGVSGEEIFSKEGYFCKKNEIDAKGRLVSASFYGIKEEAVYCSEGYHKAVFGYDDRDNMSLVEVYGTKGQLIPFSGFWAKQELSYNGGGNVENVTYYNQFDKLVNVPGNYARIENKYDDRGLLESTSYYNADGKLSADRSMNASGVQSGERFFAKVVFAYDEGGNPEKTEYYDEEGNLTSDYPFSTKLQRYDETGKLIQDSYVLPDGTRPENYFNDVYYAYDDYGHLSGTEYYGAKEAPMETQTVTGTKAHRIIQTLDYRGNVLERKVYDKDQIQTEHVRYQYNKDGFETLREYLDEKGQKTLCRYGYAKAEMEYDKWNNLIGCAYYDENDNLTVAKEGYAFYRCEFDKNGMMTELSFFGADGKAIKIPNGYSCIRETVNQRRNVTEAVFLDETGEEIFTYHVSYNENGQKIMESREISGAPDNVQWIARKNLYYDSYGNQCREEYYDEAGNTVLAYSVLAGWESVYNELGLETKRTYLDMDLKPVCIPEGFASAEFRYDDYGREKERKFLDENGIESNCKFGFSRYEITYTENGEIKDTVFYDAAGNVLTDVNGEVLLVELNINGRTNPDGARYHAELGQWSRGPVVSQSRKVTRIAFYHEDGSCDLMRQPYVPIRPYGM